MTDDGMIEWTGGECPVDAKAKVKTVHRDLHEEHVPADWVKWDHSGDMTDVIAYKVE